MKNIHRFIYIVIIGLVSVLMGGCQEGGDIGVFYGQWVFDEMTVDGETPEQEVFKEYYMSFSGPVSLLGQTGNMMWYGMWSREGDDITIKYAITNDWLAVVKANLGFDSPEITVKVESETSRSLRLEYIGSDGKVYKYKLRKLI